MMSNIRVSYTALKLDNDRCVIYYENPKQEELNVKEKNFIFSEDFKHLGANEILEELDEYLYQDGDREELGDIVDCILSTHDGFDSDHY